MLLDIMIKTKDSLQNHWIWSSIILKIKSSFTKLSNVIDYYGEEKYAFCKTIKQKIKQNWVIQ